MKPHILFIYADQHRYDCMGNSGHPLVRTPHLDLLARDGVSFSNAFTPIPICVPARCSLLSGQWPSQHSVVFNYVGETFKPLDPAQLLNRANHPACAPQLPRLRARLLWWMQHTHDRLLNQWTRTQLSGSRIHPAT